MSGINSNINVLGVTKELIVKLPIPDMFVGVSVDKETIVAVDTIPDINAVMRLGSLIQWLLKKNIAKAYIVKEIKSPVLEVHIRIDDPLTNLHFTDYQREVEFREFLVFYKELLDPIWDCVEYSYQGQENQSTSLYDVTDVKFKLSKILDLDEIHPELKEYIEYNYNHMSNNRIELSVES